MENVVVYEWGLNSDFLRAVAEIPSWPVVLGTAVLMIIIFYSAALSADAAERLGYNDIAFFIGGIILPYIFPLIIVPALQSRNGSFTPSPASSYPGNRINAGTATAMAAESAGEELSDDAGYDFDYFDALPVNEKGERPGPFTLSTVTGNTYTIAIIRKLYPDRGVFIIRQDKGDSAESSEQSLRIKYEQIEYFDKLT